MKKKKLKNYVNAERCQKQYIKREKVSFVEKILKLVHGPIFLILWEKYYFFPQKLKPTYKMKKKIVKNYVKARTTVAWLV
jgi:hypothetical protein